MKKTLLTILMTLALVPLAAQERPRVAVVLSGGGAKGVAHIGALKVIEEAGIPVDIVCGTSMGALVGSLYSLGYSTDFLDSLVRAQDWPALFSDRTDPTNLTLRQRREQNTYFFNRRLSNEQPQRGGIIRGRNLDMLFRQLCNGYLDSISFDSLPRPFACVATDLVSNREVVFHSGYLTQAMRASMAIPGVFTPVRIGDMVLVDGGLKNNYPADIARQMGADIVIGVSVQDLLTRPEELSDLGSVMGQLISINSRNKFTDNIKQSDIFIHVDITGYSAASFTAASVDTLIRRGEETTRTFWDQLIALRNKYHLDAQPSGLGNHSPKHRTLNTSPSETSTPTLEPHNPSVSAGFRFDSEEMGVLQLAVRYPLSTLRYPLALSGTLRLGNRILAQAEGALTTGAFNPAIAYTFQRNDMDIYSAGARTYNVRYRRHTVDLVPLNVHLRRYELRTGIRWDYFNYFGQLLSADGTIPSVNDGHYFSYYITTDRNTENDWYFPTRGSRLHTSLLYRTDNFIGIDGHAGIGDLSAHWRANIPVSEHWSLQPMLYARSLHGSSIPLAFVNFVGGDWFGHYVEQQLPMTGVGRMEAVGNHFAAIQLQLQCRLFKSQYLLLRVAGAYQTDDLSQLSTAGLLAGAQAGYSWMTIIGPLDARIGYSSLTRQPYLYFNIGHIF